MQSNGSNRMVLLTRLNHAPVYINSDLIEHIETTPDTVITLTTGQKMVVLEGAEEVVKRVIDFRRLIGQQCPQNWSKDATPVKG